jgi:NACalpha-BTF3-like transcription factor
MIDLFGNEIVEQVEEKVKSTKKSPFDFLNAINVTKENLMAEDEFTVKDYSPFMVNRGLSYFPDTILYANEMNRNADLDNDIQFSFLLNSVTKRKRFSKWFKKDPDTDDVKLVMEYYGYSNEKALQALQLLSPESLEMIKEKLYKGGR